MMKFHAIEMKLCYSLFLRIIFSIYLFFFSSWIMPAFGQLFKGGNIYGPVKVKGETINGLKIGAWGAYMSNTDSTVIYKAYYNEKGEPEGIWQLFRPDGSPRTEIEFRDSKVYRFAIFVKNSKHMEFICNDGFDRSVAQNLEDAELKALVASGPTFISEHDIYRYPDGDIHNKQKVKVRTIFYSSDYSVETIKMQDLLRQNSTPSKALRYDDLGRIKRENFFKNGVRSYNEYQYNKAGHLTNQKEFVEDTLVKVLKFNKDGTLKKEKSYKRKS